MDWTPRTTALGTEVLMSVRDTGGTDPAVLFVNGLGAPQRVWDLLAERLSGSRRLISYDMRGCGRTTTNESADDYDTHRADLGRLREHVGVPLTLVGWSFGAQLAVESAADRPENCTGVFALDGGIPIGRPTPGRDFFPTSLTGRIALAVADLFGVGHRLSAAQLERLMAAIEDRERELDSAYDRSACPITVVFGTRRAPQESAEMHSAALQAADRFQVRHPAIPFVRLDADHTMILARPDEVAQIIAAESGATDK